METFTLARNEAWSKIAGCNCFSGHAREKAVTLVVTVPADDLPVGWSIAGGGFCAAGSAASRQAAEAEISLILNGGAHGRSGGVDGGSHHVARPNVQSRTKARRKPAQVQSGW
jgi:hypothetical protein